MGRGCPSTPLSHLLCHNTVCVLLVYLLTVSEEKTLTRVVQTKYGRLQGVHKQMPSPLPPLEVFLGVPYATPPLGVNRFSPTRAASPWSGVRQADRFGPPCPQQLPRLDSDTLDNMPRQRLRLIRNVFPLLGNHSEDCLYLNVYAPAQEGEVKALYPVVVFIHGGSYMWNSGSIYDAAVLSAYARLVVVTLNYRLGVLGFLNANLAPRSSARVANYGLMDQVAALHWVQQHATLFGGDPDNVTLMGHGTGAACVQFLIMSPTVMPGLFQRAALLSGSALSSWALVDDPVHWAVRLARQFDCPVPDDLLTHHENIVDCLREVPLERLMQADIQTPAHLSAFGPSVDGVVIRSNVRRDLLTSGHGGDSPLNRHDLLLGLVSNEVLSRFSVKDLQSGFNATRRDKILRTFIRNAYSFHLSEIYYAVVNEYTDWDRSANPLAVLESTLAALGDALFNAPSVQTGDMLSTPPLPSGSLAPTRARTYFFVFDYQGKDEEHPQVGGVTHGEELPYLFGAPLVNSLRPFRDNYTAYQVALSEAIMLFFGNFVRSGDPNEYESKDTTLLVSKERNRFRGSGLVWEEYDTSHQRYLEIGVRPKLKNHYRAHQLSLWLRLIPELHRAGASGTSPRHNQFAEYDRADLYEGVLRPDPITRPDGGGAFGVTSAAPSAEAPPTDTASPAACLGPDAAAAPTPPTNSSDVGGPLELNYGAYSTALSVTIAIGCSLLVLNVLIFAKVYRRRDHGLPESKMAPSASVIDRGSQHSLLCHGHGHHSATANGPVRAGYPMPPPPPRPPSTEMRV